MDVGNLGIGGKDESEGESRLEMDMRASGGAVVEVGDFATMWRTVDRKADARD